MQSFSPLVIATHNPGKLREFRQLLAETGWQVLDLGDIGIEKDFEETGRSFAENARLKAVNYSRYTDLALLADDSGLEVDVLGGSPGIYSARYAEPKSSAADLIRKLLSELRTKPGGRAAQFVCALTLIRASALVMEAEGVCRGEIIEEPRGSNGFGYDPIFLVPELGRTFAELSEREKNRYSHRARAVQSLLQKLRVL